jgi:integrase
MKNYRKPDYALPISCKFFSSIRQLHLPQGSVDGEKATGTLNRQHLDTIRKLGYKFRLYDCRHIFATHAAEGGVDLLVLASILEHSNLKIVVRYAHPSDTYKAEAVKKIEMIKSKAGLCKTEKLHFWIQAIPFCSLFCL